MEKKSSVPNKWLKYEVLDYFGLRNIEEVQTTIHRFWIDEIDICLQNIMNSIKNEGGVYVIKLVYPERIYRLPNYLLLNLEDLNICKEELKTKNLQQYSEIWYCKNDINENLAFGRILFHLDELFPRIGRMQTEIVWGASARLIEKYPNLNVPFIALEKEGLLNEWYIQKAIYAGCNHDKLISEAFDIVRKIPEYYLSIRNIGEWLYDCGCTCMSLEFSISYGKFHFIDWDTDDDNCVVEIWKTLKFNRRF